MANIFILPADVFLYILKFLDIHDTIAFALTCQMLRQICVDAKVFRKTDLSRCAISTKQRGAMDRFIMDQQLTQHITELNVSNFRVQNWQMDDKLEEFIISICPHLETLHVVNCGMSFQKLHYILKQAPKLMTLSWSVWDYTSEDIQFVVNSTESSEGMCSRNIKQLRLDVSHLFPHQHLQIAKYLVLSHFRDLEELEIHFWLIDELFSMERSSRLLNYQMIPGIPQPSDEIELQHLHSLMVVPVGGPLHPDYQKEVYDFFVSVLGRKTSSTKWKKLWIPPSIGISDVDWSLFLDSVDQDNFQSVEAIAANPDWSDSTVDKLQTFFDRIGDCTVRSLDLCLPDYSNSIVEFCQLISRVGGHSLKCFRFFVRNQEELPAEQNIFIHTLFSNCSNIIELDLFGCYFEKDICESLSKLKHLTKVQLIQCAISSKYKRDQVQTSEANLLILVEKCKNITHLDVRGCDGVHVQFSCRLTDYDLLALAKLRNLKSLILFNICGITGWTFLQNISEDCKFLTTLKIAAWQTFQNSHIPILMESSKFLKHLAIRVNVPVLESEDFWNILSCAKNLERLCIRCGNCRSLNVAVAVEILRSLPRLHFLHLHTNIGESVEDFYDQMIRMFKEKELNCRFSFEIVTGNRMSTRINLQIGHIKGISNKALPLNEAELCYMTPILAIPRL